MYEPCTAVMFGLFVHIYWHMYNFSAEPLRFPLSVFGPTLRRFLLPAQPGVIREPPWRNPGVIPEQFGSIP